MEFLVSCYHSDPKYCLDNELFEVQRDGDKFCTTHPIFGSSKNYDTPEAAIRYMLWDHNCHLVVIKKQLQGARP